MKKTLLFLSLLTLTFLLISCTPPIPYDDDGGNTETPIDISKLSGNWKLDFHYENESKKYQPIALLDNEFDTTISKNYDNSLNIKIKDLSEVEDNDTYTVKFENEVISMSTKSIKIIFDIKYVDSSTENPTSTYPKCILYSDNINDTKITGHFYIPISVSDPFINKKITNWTLTKVN
ncbi:hypothetical protein [Oceanotoga teriensis]|uniref:hypothetical protein n=1 Tax=Oceanotoga teriensis TaxID=515440 RepID=UPI0027136AE2|nr:hypothetical protein [Oceanotoga teriensis]MDO7975317.1 hypothetical protein [Oceanotoga teriensis]